MINFGKLFTIRYYTMGLDIYSGFLFSRPQYGLCMQGPYMQCPYKVWVRTPEFQPFWYATYSYLGKRDGPSGAEDEDIL